ncbi:MAG: hypothetical protein FWH37_09695 [Candidatus Bathyarchaeota archaeon]|nr:hypothetical protein [Candidatus Termiticorpusculum sp.]
MNTVNFDKPEIIRKIRIETGESEQLARVMAQRLNNIQNSELHGVAIAWANGIKKPFTFKEKGLTLDMVKDKYNSPRVVAILTMDTFLKKPESIEIYNNLQFKRR